LRGAVQRSRANHWKQNIEIMSTLLLIVLILLLVRAVPWPYSSGWDEYPNAGLGLILVILGWLSSKPLVWLQESISPCAGYRREQGVKRY
jgi:Protein of unknown function (DUF3309)